MKLFLRTVAQGHALYHFQDDDRREVRDPYDQTVLTFDRRLGCEIQGERVGELFSRGDTWWLRLVDGAEQCLNIAVRDHHWTNLELAEVEAAKILLEL